MENVASFSVSKEQVEAYTSQTFTDKEWKVLSADIVSFMDYAIWQQMGELVEELPDSIASAEEYEAE